MKIAMNYYLEYADGFTGKEWVDFVRENGFKYFEIIATRLPVMPDEQDEIINYANNQGIRASLHAPYRNVNIIDSDKEKKEQSISLIKESIDIAKRYNLQAVTFHPGRLSADGEDEEEKWAELMDAVREIAEYAKEKQVKVGIENMELRKYELVQTIDDFNRLAEIGENNPYFGVTLDFVHFATHGIFSPDLKKLKLPVHNVHLSQQSDGKTHLPLTVKNGTIDFVNVCNILNDYGYDGYCVFEINDDFYKSRCILEEADRCSLSKGK